MALIFADSGNMPKILWRFYQFLVTAHTQKKHAQARDSVCEAFHSNGHEDTYSRESKRTELRLPSAPILKQI